MATVGHVACGLLGARVYHRHPPSLGQGLAWSALAFAPDIDVGMFAFVDYAHPLGHRGAAHSLAVAAVLGALVGWIAAWLGGRTVFGRELARHRPLRLALVSFLVVASHGGLDALTDGGLGIAFLWPLSDTRWFAPVRPLPVAPIGVGMWSARGLRILLIEAIWFAPLIALAYWPARRRSQV